MSIGDEMIDVERPFQHIISLGYHCATAYQIRHHTRTGDKHFFDWLYTPVDAAIQLIAGDFAGFMEKASLEIHRDAREVLDRGTGIRFNHSFKDAEYKASQALIDEDYDSERAKFRQLETKFRNVLADEAPVAFVRYNPYRGRPDDDRQIGQLARVIRTARGDRPFHLFWILNAVSDLRSNITDSISKIEMAEDPSLSTSHRGHDFLSTDDVRWGVVLGSLPLDLRGKKRPAGESVFSDEADGTSNSRR